MLLKSIAMVLTIALSASTAQADMSKNNLNMFGASTLILASSQGGHPRVYKRPPESYDGQWYTTSDGCSYSRANPPGGVSTWYLIQNPHHIGQPNAHWGCAQTL